MSKKDDLLRSLTPEEYEAVEVPSKEEIRAALKKGSDVLRELGVKKGPKCRCTQCGCKKGPAHDLVVIENLRSLLSRLEAGTLVCEGYLEEMDYDEPYEGVFRPINHRVTLKFKPPEK